MLVRARSDAQRQVALRQLRGGLSRSVVRMTSRLTRALAEAEASIDFPEDDADAQHSCERVLEEIEAVASHVNQLLQSAASVRLLNRGARVAIVGKPNVGKSSLFNALCGHERAIVTEEPGTTRDTVETALDLGGLSVTMIDTAGLGSPTDRIDQESQRRTTTEIGEADLCLAVLDASLPLDDCDRSVLASLAGVESILVRNKCDLSIVWPDSQLGSPDSPIMATSCLTGTGVEELRGRATEMLRALLGDADGTMVVSLRHRHALQQAACHLEQARTQAISGSWLEVVAEELRGARAWLRRITGEQAGDDLLQEIFSRFCVGK